VNDTRDNILAPEEPVPPSELVEGDVTGLRLLRRARKLLRCLRGCADHPNRKLHFDDYVLGLLLYFFNPVLTSLRGLQRATEFSMVRKALGLKRMSLGSMSESVRLFDPELVGDVFREMSKDAPAYRVDPRLNDLGQAVTAVDGTVLPALPRMTWAVWLGDRKRGAKAHVHFDVRRSAPTEAQVTDANASEIASLREHLEPGRLYVMDRGYRSLELLQDIVDADSSAVIRWRANARYEVIEERELTDMDRAANVVSDRVVRLGGKRIRHKLRVPVRLVEIFVPARKHRGLGRPRKRVSADKRKRRMPGEPYTLYLVTDRLDLPAEIVGLIYQSRWMIELYFRTLKSVFNLRHLLSDSIEGVTIQFYASLIATMLLSEYTGVKANKRAYELVALYLQGWVTDEEFADHVARIRRAASKKS